MAKETINTIKRQHVASLVVLHTVAPTSQVSPVRTPAVPHPVQLPSDGLER